MTTTNISEKEKKYQKFWSASGIYDWSGKSAREDTFAIDTPPPTVSGNAHMGHVFSYSQIDFIARYMRMKGKDVFFPMGWDNNGLPTERLVESVRKTKGSAVPRHEFILMCEDLIEEEINKFKSLWQSLGISIDWRQEYHTISKRSQRLSQLSFIDLYNKGYIYRRSAPTFWDSIDGTALAQTDIEDKEMNSVMYNIDFQISGSEKQKNLAIGTTRPELLPACVALLYHPDDKRYNDLKDEKAIVPIFGQVVPIIADEDVSIDKGTGLVMTCTFGDIQDINWYRRHSFEIRNCIDAAGVMQNSGPINGLKVPEAREKIVEILQNEGKISAQESVVHYVKCAERSGAPLEIIVTEQWYIKVLDEKEKILEMGEKCQWYPSYMKIRFDNWVKGLNQDWCISRQRFFGVPFPVWYSLREGEEGKIIVPEICSLPVDPTRDLPAGYRRDEVVADTDIMDTWATSAITPQLSSCAINEEMSIDYDKHLKLFPFDMRPQGHEIIRTWTFVTIVKALYHENTIPWKNIVLSGWCLAPDKKKMSKSKGNAKGEPKDLINEFGADVIRYWASNAKLGADIIYSVENLKIGKKLSIKLRNAAKFCHMHMKNMSVSPTLPGQDVSSGNITEPLDKWLLDHIYYTVDECTKSFERFEYSAARNAVCDFFWKILCDNYLELVKGRLYNSYEDVKGQSAIVTLWHALNTVVRLLAPFMPHVTEEVYQMLFVQKSESVNDIMCIDADNSVHARGMWPDIGVHFQCDPEVTLAVDIVTEILDLLRKFKSQKSISMGAPVDEITIFNLSENDVILDESLLFDLKSAMKVNVLTISNQYRHDGEQRELDMIVSEDGRFGAR